MTLYLKYRPKTLEELDLTSVRESLKKIVKSGQIPHAFLFSGPKGLGKTSAARILAKVVNCDHPKKSGEPCNRCKQCKAIGDGSHLDVIELDAASHRGIDDVRSLREAVKLAPTMAAKKVYIIDEAHMLTQEASNALLKTLEEPPEHVMFILATTNPEKLIETIRSRATNVVFKRPSEEEILRSLEKVVKGEKLKVKEDLLTKIVEVSGGSFRDAVKILETAVVEGGTSDMVVGVGDIDQFLVSIFNKDAKTALTEVGRIIAQGVSIDFYIQKLLTRLHAALLSEVGIGEEKLAGVSMDDLVSFIKLLTKTIGEMRDTPIDHLPLEVAIIEWCLDKQEDRKQKTEVRNEDGNQERDKKTENQSSKDKFRTSIQTSDFKLLSSQAETETWAKVLSAARPRNKSVEALLRAARPVNFDGKILTLGVFYSFHKERLESPPHRQILDEIVREVFGKGVRVVCTLTNPPTRAVEDVRLDEGVVLTESHNPAGDTLTKGQSKDIIKLAKEIFGN
ncbi:DNA polymerase III subunit gamma/tau [Candidatus Woesebacteria bacterium]|nr:DNA polymerase III subunit gamma/tau [Candidatus Woesebacteria bacterium]